MVNLLSTGVNPKLLRMPTLARKLLDKSVLVRIRIGHHVREVTSTQVVTDVYTYLEVLKKCVISLSLEVHFKLK